MKAVVDQSVLHLINVKQQKHLQQCSNGIKFHSPPPLDILGFYEMYMYHSKQATYNDNNTIHNC